MELKANCIKLQSEPFLSVPETLSLAAAIQSVFILIFLRIYYLGEYSVVLQSQAFVCSLL